MSILQYEEMCTTVCVCVCVPSKVFLPSCAPHKVLITPWVTHRAAVISLDSLSNECYHLFVPPVKPDQDIPSPPLLSSSSLTKCSHQSQTWKHTHKQGPWTVNNLLIRHASLRRVTDRKTHCGFWVMGWIFFQINREQRLTKAVLQCNLFLLTITDIFMSILAW